MLGPYRDEVYELNKKLTHWRSVSLGLAVGFLLTNGWWLWFCLKVLLKNKS
jgi:hypothetical protein